MNKVISISTERKHKENHMIVCVINLLDMKHLMFQESAHVYLWSKHTISLNVKISKTLTISVSTVQRHWELSENIKWLNIVPMLLIFSQIGYRMSVLWIIKVKEIGKQVNLNLRFDIFTYLYLRNCLRGE